jgi:hypothetical protein
VIRSFLVSANDPDTGVPRNMSTLPLVSTEGMSGIRVVLVCRIVKEHHRLAASPPVLLGDKAVHLVSELNCESIVPKARDRTIDLALINGVDDSPETMVRLCLTFWSRRATRHRTWVDAATAGTDGVILRISGAISALLAGGSVPVLVCLDRNAGNPLVQTRWLTLRGRGALSRIGCRPARASFCRSHALTSALWSNLTTPIRRYCRGSRSASTRQGDVLVPPRSFSVEPPEDRC